MANLVDKSFRRFWAVDHPDCAIPTLEKIITFGLGPENTVSYHVGKEADLLDNGG